MSKYVGIFVLNYSNYVKEIVIRRKIIRVEVDLIFMIYRQVQFVLENDIYGEICRKFQLIIVGR